MPLMLLLFLAMFPCHDPALADTLDHPGHIAFLWLFRSTRRDIGLQPLTVALGFVEIRVLRLSSARICRYHMWTGCTNVGLAPMQCDFLQHIPHMFPRKFDEGLILSSIRKHSVLAALFRDGKKNLELFGNLIIFGVRSCLGV